ncbi:MAG: ribonuclease HI family protein [Candidatus Berkelbacteria bacterium]
MKTFTIFTDGGSRGNPGPAAIGGVIKYDDKQHDFAECIGETTNNQAEYQAIAFALNWICKNFHEECEIKCFLDSQLVVEQLKGNYKMKNEGLKPLFWQIRESILLLGGKVSFTHIPREQNKDADALVNMALDKQMKGE